MSQTAQAKFQTLDQKRAAFAWRCAVRAADADGTQPREYRNLAKGAPALILNSGLMPTLAFFNDKGGAAQRLLDDLVRGLRERIDARPSQPEGAGHREFSAFMQHLQAGNARAYLRYTDEALELLRWIRQFVDAVPQAAGTTPEGRRQDG